MPEVSSIIDNCFINAPFLQLQQGLLQKFLSRRLRPEIGLEGGALQYCTSSDFKKIANKLKKVGLPCTLHAPFLSLDAGSEDPDVRRRTRVTLQSAFALLNVFEPKSIVCHPHLVYGDDEDQNERRLTLSLEFWREMVEMAAACEVTVMFENTYEKTTDGHRNFLSRLNHPRARFCLDVGHVMAFAGNSWTDWLPELEPWLGQLHLHDNTGRNDEHIAIGDGVFDFETLFSYLVRNRLSPLITLEPHTAESLEGSLKYLGASRAFHTYLIHYRKIP